MPFAGSTTTQPPLQDTLWSVSTLDQQPLTPAVTRVSPQKPSPVSMPPPTAPPKSAQSLSLFFCRRKLPGVPTPVNLMSGRLKNCTPPPTQMVVPLTVAVVMSWAAAGRNKAASARPAAPTSNTSLGMEAPERPKVILMITANAARKRLASGLGRHFSSLWRKSHKMPSLDEALFPCQSPQGDLGPGADMADHFGRSEASQPATGGERRALRQPIEKTRGIEVA